MKQGADERKGKDSQQQPKGRADREHGEGNYRATRDYDEGVKQHLETHDVEREAREAAPRSPEEAREMDRAEREGKRRARDGGGEDVK